MKLTKLLRLCVFLVMLFPLLVLSNDVVIEDVKAEYNQAAWTFQVTLRHDDSGWEHYADAWRVVDENNKIYGTRTLFHPHENEQPFTRSLNGVSIPANVKVVFIEAHDKVHGWNQEKFKLKLTQ